LKPAQEQLTERVMFSHSFIEATLKFHPLFLSLSTFQDPASQSAPGGLSKCYA
jgi:hypothetical protein